MGISIYCKKTGRSIDMGCAAFYRLRKNIAYKISNEVGDHYADLINAPYFGVRDGFFEAYDLKTEELIRKRRLQIRVAKFLYMSDTDGYAPPSVCKKLLELLMDADDTEKIGYAGRSDCATM